MSKQEEMREAWRKLYAKDLPIIGVFLSEMGKAGNIYRLYFKDGSQIIAEYYSSGDSDNGLDLEDPGFEDLYEFYFKVKKVEKKGTEFNFNENKGVYLNYHNFFTKFELYNEEI